MRVVDRLGHYRIIEEIGKGAMGVVYRALDETDGSNVALKVFLPDSSLPVHQQKDLLRRFEKEAEILKKIKHENIVAYKDFGTVDNKQYLAMEFLEGQNLKELLEMHVSFTVEEVADIGMQVLSGLAECHEHGIIHRDIKPANIIKLSSGIVKLTDFGIARILTDATISKTGTVVGTPNYMSPEQIKGEELTPASDLFSLGVVLYELLTKHKPFDADTITTIMYNVVNLEPPPPTYYKPDLPREIDTVLSKAMAKNLQHRYSSARAFQKDLIAVVQRLPIPEKQSLETTPLQQRAEALPSRKIIYCVDCGTPNPEDRVTCIKCRLPLLKRHQIAGLNIREKNFVRSDLRFESSLLLFLNALLAIIIFFIIYSFFHG